MSRGPSTFRQTDVVKAIKAVRIAGCSVARVMIGKDGRIDIVTTTPAATEAPAEDVDLDRELTEWEGRRDR